MVERFLSSLEASAQSQTAKNLLTYQVPGTVYLYLTVSTFVNPLFKDCT
jgi:hypothetical protein